MKKKLSLATILAMVALVIGVAALLLPLASAYSSTATSVLGTATTVVGSAYAFIFGGAAQTTITINGSATTTAIPTLKGPAPLAMAAWVILVVALLAALVGAYMAMLKGKKGALVLVVAGVLFVASGILFFSVKNNLPLAITPDISAEDAAELMKKCNLDFGFVGTAIAALLAGVVTIGAGLIKTLSKKK